MMRKIGYRLGIFLLLISSMILVTGCTTPASKINTELTINEDLSGVRKMKVSVNRSLMEEHFEGTIEDINAIITENCPEELTWTYEDSGATYEYIVELSFESVEDYNQKVHKILTGEQMETGDEPWIEMESQSTLLRESFYLEEDFTSEDLLQWMVDALIEAELISQKSAAYVFSMGDNLVMHRGQTYDTYEYAYIEEHSALEFRGFEVYTTINADATFDREIILILPQTSLETNEAEIKAYLETLVPEGAEYTIENGNGSPSYNMSHTEPQVFFTVTKRGMTAEELNAFNAHYFGNTGSKVTITEAMMGMTPFSLQRTCIEEINFSGFYDAEVDYEYQPWIMYVLKSADGYTVTGNDKQSEAATWVDLTTSKKFTVNFNRHFLPVDVDIETKVKKEDSFERSICIEFDKSASENDLTKILANIEQLFPQDASNYEELYNVKIEVKENKDALVLMIQQWGTTLEIMNSNSILFGNQSGMIFEREDKKLSLRKDIDYSEYVEIDRFISAKTENCVVNHTVIFPAGTSIDYCDADAYDANGRTLTLTIEGNSQYFEVHAKQWNVWGIAFWLLLLIVCAAAVLLLYKFGYLTKAVTYLKTKLEQVRQESQRMDEEDELQSENHPGLGGIIASQLKPSAPIQPLQNVTEEIVGMNAEGLEEQAEPWVAVIDEGDLEELDIEIDIKKM